MKRILLVLTMVAVMVVAMALAEAPAFASTQFHANNIGNHAVQNCSGATNTSNGSLCIL